MKVLFFVLLSVLSFSVVIGQEGVRPLYRVTLFKSENNKNGQITRFIEIDSLGNIFSQGKKIKTSFDMKIFSKELNKYVTEEKIDKYPGNNNIVFIEPPSAALNKQSYVISVEFLDDVQKERALRNKTYYSWGGTFEIGRDQIPFFNYLNQDEAKLLKALLE